MKIIRIAAIALVLTGLSNAAVAQMGGQGPRGAGNGAGMVGPMVHIPAGGIGTSGMRQKLRKPGQAITAGRGKGDAK